MSEDKKNPPFSMGYVLRVTSNHMQKSINISIQKTTNRIPEFMADEKRSKELLKTLAHLHAMRKQLEDFQAAHSEDFKGE